MGQITIKVLGRVLCGCHWFEEEVISWFASCLLVLEVIDRKLSNEELKKKLKSIIVSLC